jgi:AraC family transcriptional regulator
MHEICVFRSDYQGAFLTMYAAFAHSHGATEPAQNSKIYQAGLCDLGRVNNQEDASMSKRDEYENRFNRVLDHIYAHIEEDLNWDRLSEIACLSQYHFHRIYSAMYGESLIATVKRIRLQMAANKLAHSNMPIETISRAAGYGSIEAFSRSFKDAFSQTPKDYRQNGSHMTYKQAQKNNDKDAFPIEVEEVDEIRCAALAHIGSYMEIGQTMGKLFGSLAAKNALPAIPKMRAIFLDDPDLVPADELRAFACLEMPAGAAIEAPLVEKVIPAGTYVKLLYKGPYADMKSAYTWLYGTWLPQSGYEPADFPGVEEYLNSPVDVAPSELLTNIWVGVKS